MRGSVSALHSQNGYSSICHRFPSSFLSYWCVERQNRVIVSLKKAQGANHVASNLGSRPREDIGLRPLNQPKCKNQCSFWALVPSGKPASCLLEAVLGTIPELRQKHTDTWQL